MTGARSTRLASWREGVGDGNSGATAKPNFGRWLLASLRAGRRGPAPDWAGGAPRPRWRLAPRVFPGGLSEVTEQGLTPHGFATTLPDPE